MNDLLVWLQEQARQYPTWAVAGAIGFAVVIFVVLLWKALRIMIVALVIAVLVAIGWYVWERFSAPDGDEVALAARDTALVPGSFGRGPK